MHENDISNNIIGAAIEVHKTLGPGLLESTYQQCLVHELELRTIRCESEATLPAVYKGIILQQGYRVDLIVENKVILELKAIGSIAAIHKAQLLTYLKLSNKKLGLLINFNVPILKQGIHRVVNNL